MRRRVGIGVALLAITLVGGSLAQGEVRQVGNLRVAFSGDLTPHALPRDRPVPVTASLYGRISTADGSRPSPLRRLQLELNRAGRITTAGLPVCRGSQLQSSTRQRALRECQPALVGKGSFAADLLESAEPIQIRGRILVFNSVRNGRSALLLHLYGTTPVQVTFVLPVAIERRDQGRFGTVMTTEIPRLAGGIGAITEISLEIGREYTYRGERRAYVSASCAAPEGFPVAPYTLARGSFEFADGKQLRATLNRNCRVRR